MALIKGINSYNSYEEAVLYFESRLDAAAWEEASEELRVQALSTAMMLLESTAWTGRVADLDQPLMWPRVGTYYSTSVGGVAVLPSSVPKQIVTAQCEVAYHLLNNDGLLDDSGRVETLKVSTITLGKIQMSSLFPSAVSRMLRDFRSGGGGVAVWRAN